MPHDDVPVIGNLITHSDLTSAAIGMGYVAGVRYVNLPVIMSPPFTLLGVGSLYTFATRSDQTTNMDYARAAAMSFVGGYIASRVLP